MNLRFVEAFHWVATLKPASRAAEKLFLTQSAMSARVAALEEEFGALLLDRRDKTLRLTVARSRVWLKCCDLRNDWQDHVARTETTRLP